jgi:hypothetical protein
VYLIDRCFCATRAYGIPMISYQRALGMDIVPDYSPYYSESTLHRHPLWPTHVLWAQLLTEVIVRSIGELDAAPLGDGRGGGGGGMDRDKVVLDGHDITYGLCMKVIQYHFGIVVFHFCLGIHHVYGF